MKRTLLVIVVVLAVLVAAGLGWYVLRDEATTSVDADDAASLVDAPEADAKVEAGDRPPAGTYEYSGSGEDHFSALGGASHEFPERVSVVVELDPDDDCAWKLHVVFVEEHLEERRLCTDGAQVTERGFDRTTEFLGRRQTSTYACSDGAFRLPRASAARASWRWTCTEERGGEVAYVGRVVDVEGDVRHVRIDGVQDDDSTGRERTELWLRADGLPVRFTTDRKLTVTTPLGSMTTTEQRDYELVDGPDAG